MVHPSKLLAQSDTCADFPRRILGLTQTACYRLFVGPGGGQLPVSSQAVR